MLLEFREFNVNRFEQHNRVFVNPENVTAVMEYSEDLSYKQAGTVKYAVICTERFTHTVWNSDGDAAARIVAAMKYDKSYFEPR
jgi:hypothetical protein